MISVFSRLVCLFAFIFAVTTQADVRYVGNAGTGILINDQPYLLDLYEVDNINPTIDMTVTPHAPYVAALSSLTILSANETQLLAIKLTEVRNFAPSYADQLLVAINKYVWRLVDRPLTLLPQGSPLAIHGKLVQLANRYGPYIRIDKSLWEKLTPVNRVALVLHESISATLPLTASPGKPLEQFQDTAKVRDRVGYIFLPDFKTRGAQAFLDVTGIRWQLSKLSDSFNYTAVQSILAWTVIDSDWALNIYADSVVDSGNNIGFCKYVSEQVQKQANPLKVKFYYIVSATSQSFFDYNSSFGTQSALVETTSEDQNKLLTQIAFTKNNHNDCLSVVEKLTTQVFSIFDQNVQKIRK